MNLSGNPFSEEANYKEYVIAHLPELVYLDFRLIDESAREAAAERYKYSVEERVHDETIAKRNQDELEEKQKERQLHKVTVSFFNLLVRDEAEFMQLSYEVVLNF